MSGNLVSIIGTWVQTVGVGAYIAAETGQARWIGLVAVAGFLPLGLLGPVGGAMADRIDRRRGLILANLAEAALATLLAVLVATGRGSPAAVTAVVFVQGCVSALLFPLAQSLIPDLVPREDLLAASSLGSVQFNMGRVVGPAVAAVVIATFSFSWAFALNAASFFAVIIALLVMRPPVRRSAPDDTSLRERIRAGVVAARADPGCRAAIGMIAVVAVLVSPFIALLPAMADRLSDGGGEATANATAVLTTAQGVGAVLGGLALADLALRFGRRRMLVGNMVATPLALVLYALAPSLTLAAVALAAVGGCYIGVLSGLSTVVQLRAPAEFRGRVLSLYILALGTVYPVAALAQGTLADVVGLPAVTITGALALLAVVFGLTRLRPTVLAALDDLPAEEPTAAPAVA